MKCFSIIKDEIVEGIKADGFNCTDDNLVGKDGKIYQANYNICLMSHLIDPELLTVDTLLEKLRYAPLGIFSFAPEPKTKKYKQQWGKDILVFYDPNEYISVTARSLGSIVLYSDLYADITLLRNNKGVLQRTDLKGPFICNINGSLSQVGRERYLKQASKKRMEEYKRSLPANSILKG